MALLNINLHPSRRELRWFGVGIFIAGLVLGTLTRWRGHAPGVSMVIWSVGAILGAVYYLFPARQRAIYLGFMYAVYPIGWCVSHLLMLIVYFLVVTPIGLILRAGGHDPLRRDFDRGASSYWVARPRNTRTERYFRQY